MTYVRFESVLRTATFVASVATLVRDPTSHAISAGTIEVRVLG